ncbi:sugar-transfer associated ATP-grasp domain-containing protein [Vibrio sp. PNB22_4_1]
MGAVKYLNPLARFYFMLKGPISRRKLKKYRSNFQSPNREFVDNIRKVFDYKVSTTWHKLYSSNNGIESTYYIPEDLFYSKIEPALNPWYFEEALKDKSKLELFIGECFVIPKLYERVSTIWYKNNKIVSVDKLIDELREVGETLVVKPSIESGGGRGVFIGEVKDAMAYITSLSCSVDLIIQPEFRQHAVLSSFHPSSLNTLRMMTLLYEGDVHLISTVLRMGVSGAKIDNQSAGGISVGVHNGVCKSNAYDKNFNTYVTHPTTGKRFDGVILPSFDIAEKLVKDSHTNIKNMALISWDVAIGKDGDVRLVELNVMDQEINFHQLNNGPIFEKYFSVIKKSLRTNGIGM